MGLKTLLQLIGLLLVILLVVMIAKCAGSRGGVTEVRSTDEKKKVFADFPINEVESIRITGKDGELTVEKGEEFWQVKEREDYPADTQKVAGLIQQVWDLNIGQPVPLARDQFGRVQLLDPKAEETAEDEAALILEMRGAEDRELGTLWLGKVHETSEGRPNPFGGGMMMTDAGRYVKKGDSNAVFIVGETFDDAEVEPSEWLDDSFFEVSEIRSIALQTGNPEDDWKLTREELTADFSLVDAKEGEELDQTKVTSMKTAFSSPRFEDVLVGEEAVEPEKFVFTIEAFPGFTYVIAAGEKSDLNDLPLTVKVSGDFPEAREPGEEESDEEKARLDQEFADELEEKKRKLAEEKRLEGRVFKVRSFVVDSIAKKRSELLAEKEEGEEEADPSDAGASPPLPSPAPATSTEMKEETGSGPEDGGGNDGAVEEAGEADAMEEAEGESEASASEFPAAVETPEGDAAESSPDTGGEEAKADPAVQPAEGSPEPGARPE